MEHKTPQSAPVVSPFPSWKERIWPREGSVRTGKQFPNCWPQQGWKWPAANADLGSTPCLPCQRSLFVDVFTNVSPQIFRDMGVGELHYSCSISRCIDQLLVMITDCSLALHFALFEFLKWEQWGKRCLYSIQWLTVRTQITSFTLHHETGSDKLN